MGRVSALRFLYASRCSGVSGSRATFFGRGRSENRFDIEAPVGGAEGVSAAV